MQARPIDPRDIRSEVDEPRYRVHFWRGRDGSGWQSDEWELTAARDVHEALHWAGEHADGRSFVLYALAEANALIRLSGADPTRPAGP